MLTAYIEPIEEVNMISDNEVCSPMDCRQIKTSVFAVYVSPFLCLFVCCCMSLNCFSQSMVGPSLIIKTHMFVADLLNLLLCYLLFVLFRLLPYLSLLCLLLGFLPKVMLGFKNLELIDIIIIIIIPHEVIS